MWCSPTLSPVKQNKFVLVVSFCSDCLSLKQDGSDLFSLKANVINNYDMFVLHDVGSSIFLLLQKDEYHIIWSFVFSACICQQATESLQNKTAGKFTTEETRRSLQLGVERKHTHVYIDISINYHPNELKNICILDIRKKSNVMSEFGDINVTSQTEKLKNRVQCNHRPAVSWWAPAERKEHKPQKHNKTKAGVPLKAARLAGLQLPARSFIWTGGCSIMAEGCGRHSTARKSVCVCVCACVYFNSQTFVFSPGF